MRKTKEQINLEKLEAENAELRDELSLVNSRLEDCKYQNEILNNDILKLTNEIKEYGKAFEKYMEKKSEKETVEEFMRKIGEFTEIAEQRYIIETLNTVYMKELTEANDNRRNDYKYSNDNLDRLTSFMKKLANGDIVS